MMAALKNTKVEYNLQEKMLIDLASGKGCEESLGLNNVRVSRLVCSKTVSVIGGANQHCVITHLARG